MSPHQVTIAAPTSFQPRAGGRNGCASQAHGERLRACILRAIEEMTPAAQEHRRSGPTERGLVKYLRRGGIATSPGRIHAHIQALVRDGRLWKAYAKHGGIQIKRLPHAASVNRSIGE